MTPLAALALATPIFGFALTPPPGDLAAPPGAILFPPVFAQLADAAEDDAGDDGAGADEEAPAVQTRRAEPAPVPTPRQTAETSNDEYAAQLRQRADLMPVHRAFGIATWVSMLATVTLGMFQYYNLYGFFGGVEDSGCVRGDAIFGQEQCWGEPWVHRASWIATTALYTTTFTISLAMPDPDHLDQGDGAYASNLRLHKVLRWAHLGGMLAQLFLGLAISQDWFGLDRANDFAALQALATVHQVVGLTTFGLLTAAGAIMLF
ncbi:MAG: hypothetical protein KF729_23610 [Sandaracinaceae bacterium]|nr:hypothetical protein [Sandaracinaceae bacterium]